MTYTPGEPKPAYTGNGIVTRERERPTKSNWSYEAGHTHITEMMIDREIWDGQSWFGGYQPFCTLRCALDYARKAYKKESRK